MDLQTEFTQAFHTPPSHLARAPGRVNLIGEHTDYNDGFVLPMAIDRQVQIAARARNDRIVRMVALDFRGEQTEFSLDAKPPQNAPLDTNAQSSHAWDKYVRGVAWSLQQRGLNLVGADMLIQGNVPIGSGLASSAALEVAAALILHALDASRLDLIEIARACQQAENEFVGVQSGIMDQIISLLARKGHAVLIDCRDLSSRLVPLPHGAVFIVCDTKKRRGLVDSKYNTRRQECQQAARQLGVGSLRDLSLADLERHERNLPSSLFKRARHVVSENDRVLRTVEAARRQDLPELGALMNASHSSLRDDYAVSCVELDTMVELAQREPGCYGARLTGAGFGGCTVNLVEEQAAARFVTHVAQGYTERGGIAPEIFLVRASAGASDSSL